VIPFVMETIILYCNCQPVRRNMEIIIIDNHDVVYLSTALPFETLRAAHGELPGPLSGVLQGFHFVHLPELGHVVSQGVVWVGG